MTTTNLILNAIEKGMLKAQRDYHRAAGTFFNNFPEYYLRGIIFNSLVREIGDDIGDIGTLETKYSELAESVKHTSRGRAVKQNPNGSRCDIACWDNKTNEVIAFVEIKKDAWDYQHDVERLYQAIKGEEAVGIFSGLLKQVYKTGGSGNRQNAQNFLDGEAIELKSKIQEYLESLNRNFRADLHNHKGRFLSLVTPYQEKSDVKESWLYRPVCLIIKPK
jgi:hypothetical protein